MRFAKMIVNPSRSSSGAYFLHCWRKCVPHSVICWMQRLYTPVSPHGAMQWSQKGWDFCHLNVQTKKDSYPLRWIQEALKSMAGAAYFSTMDFKSGFWQVKMVPDLQQYTAFTVGNLGLYEFTCMPFGLCNAPVTFQHLMQNTLGELNLTYYVIYLNDVIVFGCTKEEHLECLRIMFEWFHKFNLKLKPSKCSFFQSEIVYLAHYVSQEGICPSQDNVHTVEEFPMCETYTQVHTFCGLMGHYRRFIKGFVHITWPQCVGKGGQDGPRATAC